MLKGIIDKIKKANERKKFERTMFEAKILNLYTKEIETIVVDGAGLANIVVHGFDVIERKEI